MSKLGEKKAEADSIAPVVAMIVGLAGGPLLIGIWAASIPLALGLYLMEAGLWGHLRQERLLLQEKLLEQGAPVDDP